MDECLNSPCQNGGLCQNALGTYFCTCKAGWNGVYCENGKNKWITYGCTWYELYYDGGRINTNQELTVIFNFNR